MFSYNKFLEFPVKVSKPNPRLANVVITQYGGPTVNSAHHLDICRKDILCPMKFQRGCLRI